jgi:Raf kinase inhibitor-like YbhB/YbcL family protein
VRRAALIAVAAAAALGGCGGGGGEKLTGPPPAAPDRIRLTSPAFAANETIPVRFTCSGAGVSPPLAWTGVPAGARELALLVEDPDAPGGTFVHWILFKLAPRTRRLAAGTVPRGARQGESSTGDARYAGPCPPDGDQPHHYEFVLYALSKPLDLPAGAPAADVRAAVEAGALARGRLVGRFARAG